MDKLKTVLSLPIDEARLPARFRDHPLKGEWHGFRELHIEPDGLSLYAIDGEELWPARGLVRRMRLLSAINIVST